MNVVSHMSTWGCGIGHCCLVIAFRLSWAQIFLGPLALMQRDGTAERTQDSPFLKYFQFMTCH